MFVAWTRSSVAGIKTQITTTGLLFLCACQLCTIRHETCRSFYHNTFDPIGKAKLISFSAKCYSTWRGLYFAQNYKILLAQEIIKIDYRLPFFFLLLISLWGIILQYGGKLGFELLFFTRENCLRTNEETISGYFGEKNVSIFIREKSSEELHLRKLLLPNFGHGNIKFRTIKLKKKNHCQAGKRSLIFIAYGSGMLCLYFSLGAPQSNLITTSTNISKRHFISCRIFGPLLCFLMISNLQTIYPDMLHLSTQSLSFVVCLKMDLQLHDIFLFQHSPLYYIIMYIFSSVVFCEFFNATSFNFRCL